MLIISVLLGILLFLISGGIFSGTWNVRWFIYSANVVEYLQEAVVAFLYWTALESGGGQSVGKKVMKLALVGKNGRNADVRAAALSAFGKAFLLPLDFIIGVLARRGEKLRLFNIVSDTIVVKK